ncbi:hypothetical protein JOC95_002946 [Bacillus tianshenii]|jgi:hypothetical protein|uniref:Transposase n=1 Tax=Sutcliffiella tianshenii TaxID=1463404 RepID=A0ABS2P385_9BACI|nr:hypothetical protein [Bacillus tianshenii]
MQEMEVHRLKDLLIPCSFEPTQEQLGKPNRTPRYGNESWV